MRLFGIFSNLIIEHWSSTSGPRAKSGCELSQSGPNVVNNYEQPIRVPTYSLGLGPVLVLKVPKGDATERQEAIRLVSLEGGCFPSKSRSHFDI